MHHLYSSKFIVYVNSYLSLKICSDQQTSCTVASLASYIETPAIHQFVRSCLNEKYSLVCSVSVMKEILKILLFYRGILGPCISDFIEIHRFGGNCI